METVNIGFGDIVLAGRMIAVVAPTSMSVKRMGAGRAGDRAAHRCDLQAADARRYHHGQRTYRALGDTAGDHRGAHGE